jgi:hypothetical protein
MSHFLGLVWPPPPCAFPFINDMPSITIWSRFKKSYMMKYLQFNSETKKINLLIILLYSIRFQTNFEKVVLQTYLQYTLVTNISGLFFKQGCAAAPDTMIKLLNLLQRWKLRWEGRVSTRGDNLRRFECHSKRGGGTDWPIRIVSAPSPSPFRLSQIPLTWHSGTEVVTSGGGGTCLINLKLTAHYHKLYALQNYENIEVHTTTQQVFVCSTVWIEWSIFDTWTTFPELELCLWRHCFWISKSV